MEEAESKYSFIGIGLGSVALLLALMHFWAGPFSPQPTLENTVAEKAVAIKKATMAALKGQKTELQTQTPAMDADQLIRLSTSLLGGLAIILSVFGYAKKEPMRIAGGAALLGSSALAFQFITLAFGVIIVVILIAIVLSQIGIS